MPGRSRSSAQRRIIGRIRRVGLFGVVITYSLELFLCVSVAANGLRTIH
jgi:hypothetical protein